MNHSYTQLLAILGLCLAGAELLLAQNTPAMNSKAGPTKLTGRLNGQDNDSNEILKLRSRTRFSKSIEDEIAEDLPLFDDLNDQEEYPDFEETTPRSYACWILMIKNSDGEQEAIHLETFELSNTNALSGSGSSQNGGSFSFSGQGDEDNVFSVTFEGSLEDYSQEITMLEDRLNFEGENLQIINIDEVCNVQGPVQAKSRRRQLQAEYDYLVWTGWYTTGLPGSVVNRTMNFTYFYIEGSQGYGMAFDTTGARIYLGATFSYIDNNGVMGFAFSEGWPTETMNFDSYLWSDLENMYFYGRGTKEHYAFSFAFWAVPNPTIDVWGSWSIALPNSVLIPWMYIEIYDGQIWGYGWNSANDTYFDIDGQVLSNSHAFFTQIYWSDSDWGYEPSSQIFRGVMANYATTLITGNAYYDSNLVGTFIASAPAASTASTVTTIYVPPITSPGPTTPYVPPPTTLPPPVTTRGVPTTTRPRVVKTKVPITTVPTKKYTGPSTVPPQDLFYMESDFVQEFQIYTLDDSQKNAKATPYFGKIYYSAYTDVMRVDLDAETFILYAYFDTWRGESALRWIPKSDIIGDTWDEECVYNYGSPYFEGTELDYLGEAIYELIYNQLTVQSPQARVLSWDIGNPTKFFKFIISNDAFYPVFGWLNQGTEYLEYLLFNADLDVFQFYTESFIPAPYLQELQQNFPKQPLVHLLYYPYYKGWEWYYWYYEYYWTFDDYNCELWRFD